MLNIKYFNMLRGVEKGKAFDAQKNKIKQKCLDLQLYFFNKIGLLFWTL